MSHGALEDKHGDVSPVQGDTSTTLEQEEEYIIPEHLTRDQWNRILFEETTDEVVGELMGDFMAMVMDACLKINVKKQVIPYTMSWAESYLTAAVEQQFLCLDAGHGSEEVSRNEDSEPTPTSDPWVQGILAVHVPSQSPAGPSTNQAKRKQANKHPPKHSEWRTSSTRLAKASHPAPKVNGQKNPTH